MHKYGAKYTYIGNDNVLFLVQSRTRHRHKINKDKRSTHSSFESCKPVHDYGKFGDSVWEEDSCKLGPEYYFHNQEVEKPNKVIEYRTMMILENLSTKSM